MQHSKYTTAIFTIIGGVLINAAPNNAVEGLLFVAVGWGIVIVSLLILIEFYKREIIDEIRNSCDKD